MRHTIVNHEGWIGLYCDDDLSWQGDSLDFPADEKLLEALIPGRVEMELAGKVRFDSGDGLPDHLSELLLPEPKHPS